MKQYEGTTQEEIKEMSLKDFEAHENERMTTNACIVAEELVKRIDGAPVLSEYIHCQLSDEPSKMFFFNRDSLQAYQNARTEKKKSVPGSEYIHKMMQFMSSHYIYGELFMEYVKFSCSNSTENASLCELCSNNNWIGPPSDRIPQPVPDDSNPGHFMDVLKTPVKGRQPDDWQPRAYIKNMCSNGEITLNDEELIQQTSKKLNVEVCHVVQSIEHLRNVEASKRVREKKNEEKKKKRVNMKYDDFDWIDLVVSRKINKLYSAELDKYLVKHQLNTKCRKSDKIKAITVHALRAGASVIVQKKQNIYSNNRDSGSGSDDELDVVYQDLDDSTDGEDVEEEAPLITTTRYGRSAGTWRLTKIKTCKMGKLILNIIYHEEYELELGWVN